MTAVERPAIEHPDALEPRGRRRWPWLLGLVVVAIGVFAVLSTGFGRDPTVVESVLLNEPAPPLHGPTLDGGDFDLAEHRGQVVVVNVWASWCVPCRREYPLLEQAAVRLAPYDVQFVGINTQDTPEDAQAFLDELGGSGYPSVLDPAGRWAVEWGTFGVPETFVVDQDGRLREKRIGELTPGWIVQAVAPLLEGQ